MRASSKTLGLCSSSPPVFKAGFLLTFLLIFQLLHGAFAANDNILTGQTSSANFSSTALFSQLAIRQDELPAGTCTKDIPCATYACCNGEFCGFTDKHCGKDVCTSKCDAKAECGEWAAPKGKTCPLNVCCSVHGFCGTTKEFCEGECQSNCNQPGSTNPSDSDVRDIVIGYVEAWSFLRRGCANRDISHIPPDSLTHLYVSFGYIEPNSYDIYPIPGSSIEVFKQIADLKQRAPGLRVWLALGGWTFSDNGTDTQPVFGDLSRTSDNRLKFIQQLEKFMLNWGFDGVDIDWEYPGATDRGGNEDDGRNFVLLLSELRSYFNYLKRGWGISFTAPTSYWYLRHYNIRDMMQHVDFVNLMTYDIHGSWDDQSNWIGPYVYAHTNLTEIKHALDLLWRNDVPANQVNLGLGFYGRTYTLKDPDCDRPGCGFSDPGNAGSCSGQAGYMSYQDISYRLHQDGIKPIHDEEAAVNYFKYDGNQWISYDSVETIKQKVEFANSQGLRGLFIWAITQDTYDNELLDAVLYPDGLGKFRDRNGAGNDGNDWTTIEPGNCQWSDCDGRCSGPSVEVTHVRCEHSSNGDKYKKLCCPVTDAPDPKTCHWRSNEAAGFCRWSGSTLCHFNEQEVAQDRWYLNNDGSDNVCLMGGTAAFCCEEERPAVCKWEDRCIGISDDKPSNPGDACPSGKKFVTYRLGDCSRSKSTWQPYCCEGDVKPSCRWTGTMQNKCDGACDSTESFFGRHNYGGGRNCFFNANDGKFREIVEKDRGLCCDTEGMRVTLKTLPVPMEYLFPDPGDVDENDLDFSISVDADPGESLHPNDNSFGWYIMSGPDNQFASLNKRDGSDWEVFDCDSALHDGLQSAKMICTKELDHNCNIIFEGGVADTVIEMPHHCGPGKYAMAVSVEPIPGQLIPRQLEERVPRGTIVYNLTFDYGFHRLDGRDDNEVLLRIDYSDSPNYWQKVVAAAPNTRKRGMDELTEIVKRDHSGDWKRYLDHTWKMDKRSTPPSERHLLHERWFSVWLSDKTQEIKDWIKKQGDVNLKSDLLDHRVSKKFQYDIFKESRRCPVGDYLEATVEAHIYAIIKADIQTSAVLSLIGNLNNLRTFNQSHIMFRNKGSVDAALVFKAYAELRLPHLEDTLFGIAPLGASFKIPGLVTIGPEFKVVGAVEGRISLDANARIDFKVAEWDYSQTYPYIDNPINDENDPTDTKYEQADEDGNAQAPKFGYSVAVEGIVEVHVIPMITFGIVFHSDYSIPNAAVDLAVDTYARLYGSASSSTQVTWQYCYGAEAGYEIFARVSAPTLFGVSLNRRDSLMSGEVDAIPKRCEQAEDTQRSLLDRNESMVQF